MSSALRRPWNRIRSPSQLARDDAWALAVQFRIGPDGRGTLAVARRGRAFSDDERALIRGLVERARTAAEDIVAHELLREQAQTDPLTSLGNRRKLTKDLGDRLVNASHERPLVLMLFDLDGFKSYNDTFGHVAGDALLARLGRKLEIAVAHEGSAYRLGGDEFCVLLPAHGELQRSVAAAAAALRGAWRDIRDLGVVWERAAPARSDDDRLRAAARRSANVHTQTWPTLRSGEQAHDVLIHILRARQHGLPDHSTGVTRLAVRLGRRLGMNAEEIDELARAAALHDIGKVGIPDAILAKPGPLDAEEWDFIRQHTVLGERILSAAPALRPVATHRPRDARTVGRRAAIQTACAATTSPSPRESSPSATPTTRSSPTAATAPHEPPKPPAKSSHARPDINSTPQSSTAFLEELDRSDTDQPDHEAPPHHGHPAERHIDPRK